MPEDWEQYAVKSTTEKDSTNWSQFEVKKNPSPPVVKTGSAGYGLGSNPFQPSVNTATPIVKQLPVKYVKPVTKPKNLQEAVDDDNNYLGAVWNQLANSGSDFIGGMTRLIAKSNPYGSPVMAGVADELGNRSSIVTDNSFRTESSSKSNEEKIQSGFDLSNGISLDDAKALPLLISRFAADAGLSIPTAGASFIAQGYNTGLKEYDKATEGQPVDQNTRELFGIGYAGINGLLDKLSLGLITKSPTVAKGIKKTILGLGIKELAKVEGKITNEIIEQTFNKVAKQSFNKIKTAGVKAFTSGAIEGSTESGQGALSDGLKLLTNKLSDKEIFNKEEIVEGFLANRLNDFGGGAILGGAMGGGVALMSSKSIIAKRVAESTTPEQLDLLKNEIASEVEAGTMDADRAESLMVAVDKYAGAKKKLPADLSTKQTEKVLDTIIERDAVAETIKQKTEQAAKSDEALAPQTQQELDLLEAKRQSLNDNIVEVTTDEKYSYSVDPESGKYFKQLGEDGKPEEITEQQYKLEKQVAPKVEPIVKESSVVEQDLTKKTDSDIENRMSEIEGDSNFNEEFNSLEKEMGKRERESVFNVPLSEVGNSVDVLMQKEKNMPNGFGSFIEKRDASETKAVADRYLDASKLTDNELKQDFSDAVRGNPTTWYADGLKLRESIKEASKRGIDTKEMIDEVIKVYTEAGYDLETAKSVVSGMIEPIVNTSSSTTFEQSTEIPTKQINLDSKPQDDLLLNGEQVTGEPTNTDTAVETNQGAGAIDQATNNPNVSEVGGEAVKRRDLNDVDITEEANVLSMLYDSKILTNTEKNILYRQYKRGVVNESEVSRFTAVDIKDIQSGTVDKWGKIVLNKLKGKELLAEDIDFEEIIDSINKVIKSLDIQLKDNRIVIGGVDAGIGEFTNIDANTIEIDRIYLDKEYQKKGIGSTILEKLFNENPNVEKIVVYPLPSSEPFWTRFADTVDKGGNFIITKKSLSRYKNNGVIEGLNEGVNEGVTPVLQKAETDLSALKQVENKSAKYEGSVKRLTEAKNAGQITEQEFNDTLNRFDDVMAEYTPKGAKSVNLNESIPDGGYILDGEVKKPSAEKLTEIKARRDAAYKRVRAKGAQANTLFSPEVISDLVEIGSTYIEEGIVRFSDFAERLQKEYGKEIPTSVIKEVYEKSAEANGLGVRKFPESVQNSELSQEVKEETLNTSTPYTKQDLHDLEDKVDAMSEMDRMAEVAKLTSMTEGKEGDLNIGVLAGISLMNEYSAAGKVQEAGKIADMLSQSATIIAQTLRQFGQLRKSSAASFIVFVEKHLGEKGKKLNDVQRKRITELFEKQKQLFQELEIAQEAYAENLDPVSRKKYYDALEAFDNATRDIEGYLEQLLPRDLWDTLSSILKGNLLTFKSLLANPLYNIFYLPVRFGRGEIANAVDFIISNVAKTPRSKASSLTPTSAILAGRSLWTGLKTATKNSLRGNTGGDLAKYDVGRGLKPIEAWKRLLSPGEGRDFSEKLSDFFEGTIGISANMAFRGLPFGDAPFSELAKNQRLYEIAVTKGLKGQDIERFMIKPDDDSLKDARSYGDSATFQDNNALSTAAKQTLKAIEESAAKIHPHFGGAVKLTMNSLFPFIKTPASVALKIVQYSTPIVPTVRAMFLSSEALKATENFKKNPSDLNRERVIKKQRLLSEAIADVAIASALTAVARIIVANGLITGSAPEEKERKKERDFMFATQPPFTINISGLKRLLAGDDPTYKQGDTAVTYNVLGIMGAVMGIVNDTRGKELREEAKNAKKVGLSGKPYFPKEESGFALLQELLTDGASTLPASVKYLTEQSFLQGVESVMGAISKGDYDRLGTQLYRTILNLPVPNTYTQVNKSFRETMKDPYTDSQWETFANIADERLGDAEGLPERLNIWGEPVPQTPEGSNKFLYQAVDPFRTQSILTDPVTMKVFDIQRKSQSTDAIPPSVPRYITIRGERRDLTKEQYQQFAQFIGQERKKAVAVILKNYNGNSSDKLEYQIERLKSAYEYGSKIGKGKFLNQNKDLLRQTPKI